MREGGRKHMVRNGAIELATQTFGHPGDTPVVLVMGATASMLFWPDDFCRMLAARGCFVIRYDNRDTGESTTGAVGQPGYAVEDLCDDLFSVMDSHGLRDAHVVGMSLGGLIVQMAALTRPRRVRSLTLIASEPLGWDGDPLPSIAPTFLAHFATMEALDWTDRTAVEAFMVEAARLCAGTKGGFDPLPALQVARADFERSSSLQAAFNHALLQMKQDWTGRFRDTRQPTLVIHGMDDPILPPANGAAIAQGIAGAAWVAIEGLGHELPSWALPELVDVIDRHLRGRRT